MICIQLIRIDAVFSRITLVSCFCAKNELSGKILENMPKNISHQKIHGAKRGDRGEAWGPRPTPGASPPDPAPGGGLATPGSSSASLCDYKLPFDLKNEGGSIVFQKEFRSAAAATRNQDSDPETLFWHPAGSGNLERIIAVTQHTTACVVHYSR